MMEPEAAAHEMCELMGTSQFSRSFPWGIATAARLTPFLPNWIYRRLFG